MAEEQQTRYRKPKNHPDPIQSTRPKSTISFLLSTNEKKYFTSTRFRGLGCTAPAQVSSPAMIKKKKMKKSKNCISSSNEVAGDTPETVPVPEIASSSSSCLVVGDVWCGPGNGLSTDAASVDCVVSRRPISRRGKIDVETRERGGGSYGGRRMVHPEDLPFYYTDSRIPHHRLHRHLRHRSPEGLSQIVMLQGNLLMGGRLDHDRYKDWRLDVDNMSYEELVDLGEKIGYVSTGLREDEIGGCVTKTKPSMVSKDTSSSHIPKVMQWKCAICQEEYEEEDEIGKLVDCEHLYHMYCIKKWLLHKKTCPICKVPASASSQFICA